MLALQWIWGDNEITKKKKKLFETGSAYLEYEEGKKENNVDQVLLLSFIFLKTKIVTIYNVPDFPYVILFNPDIKPVKFVISIL